MVTGSGTRDTPHHGGTVSSATVCTSVGPMGVASSVLMSLMARAVAAVRWTFVSGAQVAAATPPIVESIALVWDDTGDHRVICECWVERFG